MEDNTVDECFESNRKLSPVFVCLFFIFFVLILHRLFILGKTPVQIINNEIYKKPTDDKNASNLLWKRAQLGKDAKRCWRGWGAAKARTISQERLRAAALLQHISVMFLQMLLDQLFYWTAWASMISLVVSSIPFINKERILGN